MRNKKPIGSRLDDLLEEDGTLAVAEALAVKRVLAWQMKEAMARKKMTKTALARKMKTSRAALDRLLDSGNTSVTLLTMNKAAGVLGKRLRVELVNA
ncbi:MAG: XRE family transcriptional regulator [Nitrospinae bacterium]|nr:XRE family transcriptional regulator [Nitrospinota bacterium]